jgi:tripartite-type tricarboxylate transporter receptor subunit TctC
MILKKLVSFILFVSAFSCAVADKPLTIYSSYPVGSGPDNFARQVVETLSKKLSTSTVIENRPGGNGAVALASFNNAPADGLSVLLTGLDVVPTMPLIYGNSDNIKELKLLAPAFKTDLVLISSAAVNRLDDLKKLAKDRPLYGSWAIGSSSHIYGEQLARHLGIQADHAPYKDFNQWYIDVSNQQLAYSFGTIASGTALEKAGRIRFLAIASVTRDPFYPEIPTLDEFLGRKTGIVGPVTGAAFYINKNTPVAAEAKLREAMIATLQSSEVQQKIHALNYRSWINNTAEANRALNENSVRYQQLIQQLNINLKQ